jgi:hypothetical protein
MSKKSKGIGSILRKEVRERERENNIFYRVPKLDISASNKTAHKITEVTVDGERLVGHIEVCDRSIFKMSKKLNGSGGLLFGGVSPDYVAHGLQDDLERVMKHSEKIHHDLSEVMQDTIASMSEEYKEMNKAVYRKIEEHIKVIGDSLGDG